MTIKLITKFCGVAATRSTGAMRSKSPIQVASAGRSRTSIAATVTSAPSARHSLAASASRCLLQPSSASYRAENRFGCSANRSIVAFAVTHPPLASPSSLQSRTNWRRAVSSKIPPAGVFPPRKGSLAACPATDSCVSAIAVRRRSSLNCFITSPVTRRRGKPLKCFRTFIAPVGFSFRYQPLLPCLLGRIRTAGRRNHDLKRSGSPGLRQLCENENARKTTAPTAVC
jgi:hypothetical protein